MKIRTMIGIAVLLQATVSVPAVAQGVVVYKSNGSQVKVPYENLDRIETYDAGEDAAVGSGVKSISHRGYTMGAPENTILAFNLAAERGYKYVETDVAFTKDGVAVLLHDYTIDRTSNGTGNVCDYTYNELLKYDFGSWKSGLYAGTKIPTLEEFLDCCVANDLYPYIEFKKKSDTELFKEFQVQQVVDLVEEKGLLDKTSFISFFGDYLNYIKNYRSKARLGYLINTDVENRLNATISLREGGNNETFADFRWDLATDENIAICKNNGVPVEIWTVDDENKVKTMDKYITGVTTNCLIVEEITGSDYSYAYTQNSPSNDATVLYHVPGSGFFKRAITAQSPYRGTTTNRLINVSQLLTVNGGTKLKLEVAGASNLQCAVWVINESGATKVLSGTTLTASDKVDTGWQSSGYTFTTAADAKYLWLNVRKSDNSDIGIADLDYFKISIVE